MEIKLWCKIAIVIALEEDFILIIFMKKLLVKVSKIGIKKKPVQTNINIYLFKDKLVWYTNLDYERGV